MLDLTKRLESRDDAIAYIDWCVSTFELGFHPDTRADEYRCNGTPMFDPEEAAMIDARMDEAFAILPDVYAVCLDAVQRVHA